MPIDLTTCAKPVLMQLVPNIQNSVDCCVERVISVGIVDGAKRWLPLIASNSGSVSPIYTLLIQPMRRAKSFNYRERSNTELQDEVLIVGLKENAPSAEPLAVAIHERSL